MSALPHFDTDADKLARLQARHDELTAAFDELVLDGRQPIDEPSTCARCGGHARWSLQARPGSESFVTCSRCNHSICRVVRLADGEAFVTKRSRRDSYNAVLAAVLKEADHG